MKTAALLTVFSVVAAECAWSDLGETRQEIQARYQHHSASARTRTPRSPDNPVQFRHKHHLVLVWFQDDHSVAEMFLYPHGLRQDQIDSLLARQAGLSSWKPINSKAEQARLWERKDKRAIAWVTNPDSEFAVFVSMDTDRLEHLAHYSSFQAVAAKNPILWADVRKLVSTKPSAKLTR